MHRGRLSTRGVGRQYSFLTSDARLAGPDIPPPATVSSSVRTTANEGWRTFPSPSPQRRASSRLSDVAVLFAAPGHPVSQPARASERTHSLCHHLRRARARHTLTLALTDRARIDAMFENQAQLYSGRPR